MTVHGATGVGHATRRRDRLRLPRPSGPLASEGIGAPDAATAPDGKQPNYSMSHFADPSKMVHESPEGLTAGSQDHGATWRRFSQGHGASPFAA